MRRSRHISIAVVALLAIAAGLFYLIGIRYDPRSADERLAEIEAARAIPDSENAARIYNELLRDPNATSLSDSLPESLAGPAFDRYVHEPWLGSDCPELAAWIKEHEFIIDRLMQVLRFDKCRFPISIDIADTSFMDRVAPMRQWGFLLSSAANNDIAEGRFDAAMTKWQCLLRIGSHARQQPVHADHLVANAIQELALEDIARFVLKGDAMEAHLQRIEAMPLPTADGEARDVRAISEIWRLTEQKLTENLGLLDRIRGYIFRYRLNRAMFGTTKGIDVDAMTRDSNLHCVATGRATRILIAMKRYKNTNNRWPASLNEVKALIAGEILTDPLNGGSFVYKPAANTFSLYSKGKNNIDENGEWQPKASDDWPIWPPRGRSPEPEQKSADR